MKKVSKVAAYIVGGSLGLLTLGVIRPQGGPPITGVTSDPATPVAAATPVVAESLTWDQYIAQEACSNLRKGMELREAGMQAGVSASDNGYASQYKDMTMADMEAKLTKTLIETCPSDIASAAERQGI